jgi:hypothetical protein
MRRPLLALAALLAAPAFAQSTALSADEASPEAVVAAIYASIQRAPGETYDWDRERPLFIPQAVQIPNKEQTGGVFFVHTVDSFERIIDSYTTVGGPTDRGFAEEQTHAVVHQYGDVAQVFSTYQKRFWGEEEILGRGINSVQLVRQPSGAWRVVSLVWDEETGAGPIPAAYGGSGEAAPSEPLPGPADFATPEAVVQAAYAAIQRAPGEDYDWARFRALFLPQATLIPNTEQTGGPFVVHTPGSFIELVDANTVVGGEGDRGFAEEQVHAEVLEYGDVAQVFSTYQKRFWDSDEVLGRGINSFQLVRHDGRWWIVGIAWDEETGAGPIPEAYL